MDFAWVVFFRMAEEAAEKVEGLGEIPKNRPSAAKAVLILLDLCTG